MSSDLFLPKDLKQVFNENKQRIISSAIESDKIGAEIGCAFILIRGQKYTQGLCTNGSSSQVSVLPIYEQLYNIIQVYGSKITNIQLMFHTHPFPTDVIIEEMGITEIADIVRFKIIASTFSVTDLVTSLDMYLRLKDSLNLILKYQVVASYISEQKTVHVYFLDTERLKDVASKMIGKNDITLSSEVEQFHKIVQDRFDKRLQELLEKIKESPKEKKSEYINQLQQEVLKMELLFSVSSITVPAY